MADKVARECGLLAFGLMWFTATMVNYIFRNRVPGNDRVPLEQTQPRQGS